MEVSHNFPSGPLYFYASFSFNRYSRLSRKGAFGKFAKYTFKRIDTLCESSVIFTTLGNDFERLEIKITIYLSKDISFLAILNYKFYEGFKPGIYGMLDTDNNFIIDVKVMNDPYNYLGIPVRLENTAKSYFKSLTTQYDQLYNTPFGYIYGLKAMVFQHGKFIGYRKYPAYSCQKELSYPDIETIFITDGQNFFIKFLVLYLSHKFKRSKSISIFDVHDTKEFEFYNPQFADVHVLKTIPLEYNKLFLIRTHVDSKSCQDGSMITLYSSEDRTKYFVYAKMRMKILPAVELNRKIYRSPEDPCAELMKEK